ncbi:MAG TPA: tripartite tricarboxylate transporter substrate binding protein [Xanthobacteraceae bacterium]|nr:tripartite tricarboxylate transporter substrate binding protein [Xanthobacteraceae bacterium]
MRVRALAAVVAALLALLSAVLSAPASAQEWPTRPVKIIVGFAPGSSADQLARLIGQELSTALQQQFYVEYRQGNSGSLAASDTARAAPDGYTLMIGGSGPHITIPALHPNIGYDPMKDFTHIAMIAGDSYVLAANPSLGVHDIAGLVALAKTRETPLTCSSPGPGSLGQLLLEEFKRKAGIDITHVPAPDSGLMEVLGNHINMTITVPLTAGEQVRAGKVIGLAMSSKSRNPAYPGIATFAEQGYPEITGATWFWLTAPKGLPPAIAERLNGQVRRVLQLPKVRDYFERQALSSMDLDLAATNAFIGNEVTRWTALAKSVGMTIQ